MAVVKRNQDALKHDSKKLQNLDMEINCIKHKVDSDCYDDLKEYENYFFILDYDKISNVLYSILNNEYKFGDDYSDYDEIDSVEEKRKYDKFVESIDETFIKRINQDYLLLQYSISKKYAEKFSNDKNKRPAYNEVILLHYLTHAIEKNDLQKIDCFEILEYIIRNKVTVLDAESLSKHLQFLKENKDSRYVKSYVDSILEKLSDLNENDLQYLFLLLMDLKDKYGLDSVINKHYLPF